MERAPIPASRVPRYVIGLRDVVLATLAFSLLSIGCGGRLATPLSPARGERAWYEVTTAHFVLRTDLTEAAARASANDFERVYTELAEVAFPRDRRTARLDLVVLRDEREFEEYWPGYGGFYADALPGDIEHRPAVVLAGAEYTSNESHVQVALLHELTHRFMRATHGSVPPWLDEGLASYFETMHFEGNDLLMGDVPRGFTVVAGVTPTIAQLRGADRATFYAEGMQNADQRQRVRGLFYQGAWALVHFFRNGPDARRALFRQFLADLDRGDPEPVAWQRAFGAIPPAMLQSEFVAYQRATSWDRFAYRAHPPKPSPIENVVSLKDTDVNLLWMRLLGTKPRYREVMGELVAHMIAREPTSAEVAYVRGCLALRENRPEDAAARFREALESEPKDPRHLYGSALATAQMWKKTRSSEWSEASSRARRELSRSATSPDQLVMAAMHEDFAATARRDGGGRERHLVDAARLADRAVALDPTYYAAIDVRARIDFDMGRVAEAVAEQARAVSLVPEKVDATPLVARLRTYRAALAAAPVDPSPGQAEEGAASR